MFQLSYEEERWVQTTTNLIVDDSQALQDFLNNDLVSVFNGPQFTQLGGLAALRDFAKRDQVYDALKDSVLVRQSTKGVAA